MKKLDRNKLIELTSFLHNDSTTGRRVYHLINDLYEIPKCPYCNSYKKWRDNREYSLQGYINTCESETCKDNYLKDNNPSVNVKKIYGVEK